MADERRTERRTRPVALLWEEINWHGCQDEEIHNRKPIHNEICSVQFIHGVMRIKLSFLFCFDILTVVFVVESGNNNFTLIFLKPIRV